MFYSQFMLRKLVRHYYRRLELIIGLGGPAVYSHLYTYYNGKLQTYKNLLS